MKPKLFVGSSTEALKIANAIHANLDFDAEVTVWTQEVFKLSSTTIDSLTNALRDMDFGVFVFSPDDITNLRGESYKTVRDNVLFELGLFVGQLGKDRSFFLLPRGENDFHLPTDLLGITPGYYDGSRTDNNWQAATGVSCTQIRNIIDELGRKFKETSFSHGANEQPKTEEKAETQSIQDNQPKGENTTSSDFWNAYENDQFEKASTILEKMRENASDENDRAYHSSLEGLVKGKINFKEGINFIENFITENPTNPLPYITASLVYENNDLIDEALDILDKGFSVMETVEDKEALKYNKATVYIKDEQEDAALEILNELIKKKTKLSDVYLKAAKILENRGEKEEADNIYQKALKLSPKDEAILDGYGQFLHEETRNEAALTVFKKLTELFPQNSSYWIYLGNEYLKFDLNGLALEAYQKADELTEEKQAWILENIGNIYKNRGFYPQAIKYLKEAVELSPDSEYGHDRLSLALKKDTEEREKANEIIRKYKQEIKSKRVQSKKSNLGSSS